MTKFSYPVALGMQFNTNPITDPEIVELHPEKFIDLGILDDKMPGWMERTLAFHGWERFASTKTSGHTSLCDEFLYHARETNEDSFLIRGVNISFSPTFIREAYALPSVETCSYLQYIQRQGDTFFEKEVLNVLSLPNSSPQINKFPSRSLNTKAKFWKLFVESRIFPPISGPIVPWDVLVLLYCIIKKKTIDVVPLIYQSLKEQISRDRFFFPCLISKLTKAAGLRYSFHDDEKFKGIKLGPGTLRLIRRCFNKEISKQPKQKENKERGTKRKEGVEGSTQRKRTKRGDGVEAHQE